MGTTAVIIARFQTPYLHEGHLQILHEVKSRHKKVVIVLGVSPVRGSKRNPYDFYTRERMLKQSFPELIVLPLADNPSDAVWSEKLDELLVNTFPNESFILYGSRDSFLPFYSGKLQVTQLAEQGIYSATAIRKEYSDQVMDSKDFRLGINYACQNTYTKVYPTVDIALFKDDSKYLLLGKKANSEKWRLPGGFTDNTDADYESAAKRELIEECGNIETGSLFYLGSSKIDDWRYRNEDDKIITILFATDLVFGAPEAGDDLKQVKWFETVLLEKMIADEQIAEEHYPLVYLIQKYLAIHNSQPKNISL